MGAYEVGYGIGQGIGEFIRMAILYWFLLCFIPGIVVGMIAADKGRSFAGFFLLSLVFTPLIGLMAALIAMPCEAKMHGPPCEGRKCPFCAEIIKQEATMCRFCGRELVPATEP